MATIEAIATQHTDSTVYTVSFTSIPQTYQHLLVMASSRNHGWSSAPLAGVVNDTSGPAYSSGDYFSNRLSFYATSDSEWAAQDYHYYPIVTCDGIDSPAGCWSPSRWIIYDYANTNKKTSIMSMAAYRMGADSEVQASSYNPNFTIGAGGFNDTAAVTSLSLGSYSATNYAQLRGFTATLFGIKDS